MEYRCLSNSDNPRKAESLQEPIFGCSGALSEIVRAPPAGLDPEGRGKSGATMTPQDVLNRVVANAFTYLEKGLAEVDSDSEINFSLLHFYGGVELAVKACLLNEDWKLVVQEPGDADWNNFCQGKQRTVGLEDAAKRGEAIGNPEIQAN